MSKAKLTVRKAPNPTSHTSAQASSFSDRGGEANAASSAGLPAMNPGMLMRDVGNTGLRQFSGFIREEFLPQLSGFQAQRTYREMIDNDPTIGALMFTIQSTARKSVWRTEPVDDSQEAAEAAEFADTLRDDMSEPWEDTVVEALSMLGYGFAPMEVVYKRRLGPKDEDDDLPSSKFDDGMIGVRKIPIRGQDTITKWFFDENGGIRGLTQQPWFGGIVDIPIQKLLLFRPTQHKSSPEGRSILRNSYRPWFMKKRLEEGEAVMFERLSGLPVVRLPMEVIRNAQAGDEEAIAAYAFAKQLAKGVRIDEQMGVVLPSDKFPTATGLSSESLWGFELMTPSGGGRSTNDANTPIERYKTEILTSTLADFLTLGHSARGTQSLAVTKVDLFMGAIEGYQTSMAQVLNRIHMRRIWALNNFDPALMPYYKPDLAQRVDLDALSNFIVRVAQAGMPLFPDKDLEAYIRDAAGLPDISEASAEAKSIMEQAAPTDQGQQKDPNNMDNAQKKRHDLRRMIKAGLAKRYLAIGGSAK